MSLTLILSGKNTVLAANYFLVIDLSDGDYKLGLAIFETYHTNVNESNNKFYFAKDGAEIRAPLVARREQRAILCPSSLRCIDRSRCLAIEPISIVVPSL